MLDVAASFVGLLLLSPILLVVAVAVRLSSPGPAIFRQQRAGRFGKPFPILKFRTMRGASGSPGSLLTAAGDSRITPLGRWLRKTKVDELPQLWNVLVGDMSLVGPRPEVPRYTAHYSEAQNKVFAERPGITGPSIVLNEEELMAGRPDKERYYLETVLPAKLGIDLEYCRAVCFRDDLRFLLLTLLRLFRRPARGNSLPGSIEHLAGLNGVYRPRSR